MTDHLITNYIARFQTRTAAAQSLGVSLSRLWQWEHRERSVPRAVRLRIAVELAPHLADELALAFGLAISVN